MSRPDPIYLDYAATTPVDPRVAEKMAGCLTLDGVFGNPASRTHAFGWRAEEAVENARRQVADLIAADPREIVWTSGATEADNLAIKGVAQASCERGRHIITSSIEHKAVLDTCAHLETQGFDVSYLPPDANGIVAPQVLEQALRNDTILVSLMHVNNELGSCNDIAELGALSRARGIAFHVDAAQSAGKLPIDVKAMNIDLLSISAHKLYGPKGVGALYVSRQPKVQVAAQIHGGGHERGMRSGTLPTHQVVGMGAACQLAAEEMNQNLEHITRLAKQFRAGIEAIEATHFNGHPTQCYPGIINVSFEYVEGEALILALKDLAISSGSACSSASMEPSYVLRALGLADELAHASIRFSLGRFTREQDIVAALEQIRRAVSRLRSVSPQWKRAQKSL